RRARRRSIVGGTIMRTTDSPLVHWTPPAHLAFDRERWLAGFLLLGVATLFAFYVIVLEQDMQHAQLLRAQAHARAVAEAECGMQLPGPRANCLALIDGGEAQRLAVAVTPPANNLSRVRGAHLTTASLQE